MRVTIDLSTGGIATDTGPEELRSSNVYITGGSAGTQDAPYLLTDDLANSLNAAGSEDPNAPTTGGAGDASPDAGAAAPTGDVPAAETPAEIPPETPQDVQPEQQAADPAAQ